MARTLSTIAALPQIDFSLPRQILQMRFAVDAGGTRHDYAVPVHVWGGGEGPGTLVMAGQHGNEYQGVLILQRVLQRLDGRLSGNVVVMPGVNPSALAAATRTSPHDGLDLNRAFPGRADGSHTEQIAHAISTVVLPHVDAILDIHSGGYNSAFVPSVMMHDLPDRAQFMRMIQASQGFEVPLRVVIDETHKPGMLDTLAETQGKLFYCPELGGGSLSREVIDGGVLLVESFLASFGHLRDVPAPTRPAPLLHVPDQDHWIKVSADGVFSPMVMPGEAAAEGQVIGEIVSLADISAPAIAVRAPRAGSVYTVKVGGRVRPGDSVGVIAKAAAGALAGL